MDTITDKMRTYYHSKREFLIEQMQKETGSWKETGQRFEEFKPTSERRVPNEWWISIYWARNICLRVLSGRAFRNVRDEANTEQPETEAEAQTTQHRETLTSKLVSRFRRHRERNELSPA